MEKFKARCFSCKEKEKITNDKGVTFELPFAYVEIDKDEELIKEFSQYAKESEEKYKNGRVIKRALLNYCPKCNKTINVCCKDYVDFYSNNDKNTD